jgi:CHAT domain-containing protein/tetratricopeptide (TPR) repeat protein
MLSSRNYRGLLVLAGLIGVIVLGLWWRRRSAAPPHLQEVKQVSTEIQWRAEVRRLEPGKPLADKIKGGEGHRYELALAAGQFAHLVTDQRGIDVTVRLRAPDGRVVAGDVDSPNGDTGLEQIFAIPDTSGLFQLEVFAAEESAAGGRYEVRLAPLRPVTDRDRQHCQAWRLFQEGEDLCRSGGAPGCRQALAKYEAALALWRTLADREWEAESLRRLGSTHRNLGELDRAREVLREALPLFQGLGKRTEEGLALTWIGEAELRSGRAKEAEDDQQKAIAIFREIGKKGLEAGALNNLGNAYYATSETQKGLDAYRLALAVARAAKDRPEEEASALRGIGDILILQGKREAAMDALRQALAVFRQLGDLPQVSYTLSRMASISQRLDRLDEALAQLEEALQILHQISNQDGEISTLNSLGTVHLLKKETAQAEALYRHALDLSRQTGNRYGEAFSTLNLGRQRFDLGDPREALRLHEEAADRFREIGFLRGEVSTLYGSARALHALGQYAAARERLERVVEGVESLRAQSENQDLRSAFFATKQHYFELHVDILMHLNEEQPDAGHDAEALELHERRRARSLLEILAEPQATIEQGVDPQLLARARQVEQRIRTAEARLRTGSPTRSESEVDALEEKQRGLLIELADIRARMRSESPRRAAWTEPRPLKVAEMQKLLGKQTLLLVYSLGEERSFLWCLGGEGKLESHSLPGRAWLEAEAGKVRAAWSARGHGASAGARVAAQLSREILGPVARALEGKRLAIVADGALEALPFAALPDPRSLAVQPEAAEPLLARNEVVHLPSISTLAVLRRRLGRYAPPPSLLAVLADPVFAAADPRVTGGSPQAPPSAGAGNPDLARAAEDLGIQVFDPLPSTRTEAEAITRLVAQGQSRLVLDFDASRDFFTDDQLKRYRILHFATHGLLNSQHPELSGLVLSLVDRQGKPREDGFLLANEISRMDLRAQLVVLSACQTGLGGELRGEGLVGLTRSFMYAGAPRVVVSLWNVNDRATAELMTRFYKGLIEHSLPPSSALRCAQLSMRRQEEWSSPYVWAPFIFQGDWSPLSAAGSGDPSIGKEAVNSPPPPIPDTDFPPPGQDDVPVCPDGL